MASVKLQDGREITINLAAITIQEYRNMIKSDAPEEEGDTILAKTAGLQPDELRTLDLITYKRVVAAFWKTVNEPLADPN